MLSFLLNIYVIIFGRLHVINLIYVLPAIIVSYYFWIFALFLLVFLGKGNSSIPFFENITDLLNV
jgi:hypothetical protein